MNTADVLCQDWDQGWDVDGIARAGDVAIYTHNISSTGFTAINQPPFQLISPPPSLKEHQSQQLRTDVRTDRKSKQHRNPTVASYLGLGDSTEPKLLIKYAPPSEDQPAPRRSVRKRRAQDRGDKPTTRTRANSDGKKASKQRRVSDSRRIIEPLHHSFTCKLDGATEVALPTPASTTFPDPTSPTNKQSLTDDEDQVSCNLIVKAIQDPAVEMSQTYAAISIDDDEDLGQLCFDFEPNSHINDISAHPTDGIDLPQYAEVQVDGDDFGDDDLMDEDLLDLPTDTVDDFNNFKFQSSAPIQADVLDEVHQERRSSGMSAAKAVGLDEEVHISGPMLGKFVSPVTLTTRLLTAIDEEAQKPIVRSAFPAAVRDRSPVIGLSSNTVLKTCFRVGEAINQSCQAVKTGNAILIELYARVLVSERDSTQQRFTFCDLFHARPPYVQAVYAAAIWKSVQLFEYDSARLMQQGRMCRCIGTMKRDGKNWTMTVLNVWEATWDDVQWVEGIVNA